MRLLPQTDFLDKAIKMIPYYYTIIEWHQTELIQNTRPRRNSFSFLEIQVVIILPSTMTFTLAVMFPMVLLATHSYWPESTSVISVRTSSSLCPTMTACPCGPMVFHCISGLGFPSAWHINVGLEPTLTTVSSDIDVICGASEKIYIWMMLLLL